MHVIQKLCDLHIFKNVFASHRLFDFSKVEVGNERSLFLGKKE